MLLISININDIPMCEVHTYIHIILYYIILDMVAGDSM
jgi:hypothetical protein